MVADEVRKLAEQSTQAVKDIQKMVGMVQEAFSNLSGNSHEMLMFIENSVMPDYQLLIQTGVNYEKDAEYISKVSDEIASSTKTMTVAISQVGEAIQSVAATSEETAASSQEILANVNETSTAIMEISKSAQNQAQLAEKLNEIVQRFRI